MEREQAPDLVQSLLDLASLSEQILAHMARWDGHSAPDPPSPDQVFRELLGGILRPVMERYPRSAVEPAGEFLAEAVTTIEAEILLVEPPGADRGPRRGSRPPRRPC